MTKTRAELAAVAESLGQHWHVCQNGMGIRTAGRRRWIRLSPLRGSRWRAWWEDRHKAGTVVSAATASAALLKLASVFENEVRELQALQAELRGATAIQRAAESAEIDGLRLEQAIEVKWAATPGLVDLAPLHGQRVVICGVPRPTRATYWRWRIATRMLLRRMQPSHEFEFWEGDAEASFANCGARVAIVCEGHRTSPTARAAARHLGLVAIRVRLDGTYKVEPAPEGSGG